jgi:ATPase subunit of ABC transporter with duplicated ATPase domains
MENRVEKAARDLRNAEPRGGAPRGVTLRGQSPQADRLFSLAEGTIALSPERGLSFPSLLMRPGDRVALTGPNGSGKSSLIRHILEAISPHIPVLYVPQELTRAESEAVLARLGEEDEKSRGGILSRFSRLGSNPKSLLQSRLPSPGELRKLLVARGIFQNPALIVMDEPTNHLDLDSIRLLEESLAECEAAFLLASHDEVFLARLTSAEWNISDGRLCLKA